MRAGGGPRAALLLAALLSPAAATPAAGQQPKAAPRLESVEAAADSGKIDEARQALDRWFAAREASGTPAQRSRAHFLRARLTENADSARIEYARVALDGVSPYQERALLRLGQLKLAEGDTDGALTDLSRLRSDFPGDSLTAESWLWTGYAHESAGNNDAACDAWQKAVDLAGSSKQATVKTLASGALSDCAPAGATTGQFAVQVGAFQSAAAAERLRRRLQQGGTPAPLIVSADPDGWFRVRTRALESREAAERLAGLMRGTGTGVLVVQLR